MIYTNTNIPSLRELGLVAKRLPHPKESIGETIAEKLQADDGAEQSIGFRKLGFEDSPGEVDYAWIFDGSVAITPPSKLNWCLLGEELNMPWEKGMRAAANRLDLIFLGDECQMTNLLCHYANEAIDVGLAFKSGILTSPQKDKAIDEVIDYICDILKGQNSRYLAGPWFTDKNNLRS